MSKRKPARSVWVFQNHDFHHFEADPNKRELGDGPLPDNCTLTRYVIHDAKRERLIKELVKTGGSGVYSSGVYAFHEAAQALVNYEHERKKR